MKNKIFAVLTVILLCLTMVVSVSAADTHIFDSTNMFGQQVADLEAYAQKIEDTYNFGVILAVIDSAPDDYTYGYCEELYKAESDKENGIALAYNYGDNKYSFYCAGNAENLITADIQSDILWHAFAYPETYYEGGYAYLVALEEILSKADVLSSPVETTEATTEFIPSDRTLPLVADNADVLTDSQEAELITRLEELGAANALEVAIVTVDSNEGKTPEAFADDFYDCNGYGYGENDDGFMVVYNTGKLDGNRNVWISTHGKAISLLSDMDIDIIVEMIIPALKNGDYVGAFNTFIDESAGYIQVANPIYRIFACLVIGFALAFFIVKIQASKLKTVKMQVNAADYVGDVVITSRYDNFMYRNIDKSPIPKERSGSGSSSTHTSSSGRTHGGGGRSF